MPLLEKETDIWPPNLLQGEIADDASWWAMYTLSRFEKKLMRQLVQRNISFYGPTISRRYRATNGRLRTSIEPLFANYVFVCGSETARYETVCTGSVSRWMPIADPKQLITDLKQIYDLIATDADLAPERRLEPGQRVRVRTGAFKGFEGTIMRRENQVRLLVCVRYMNQGASVALDDCQLEPI